MKPTHEEICQAIVIIGAKYADLDSVRPETIHLIGELGLAKWNIGRLELTSAGGELLAKLLAGEEIPELV